MKTLITLFLSCAFLTLQAQTTVQLNPSQDNTIYSENPSNSGGNGSIFSGLANQSQSRIRRALLQFDLSAIPADAIITEALLQITVTRQGRLSQTENYSIHRVNTAWVEGASTSNGVGSSIATGGGATWNNANTNTPNVAWATPGGDFEINETASVAISGLGDFTFATSTNMVNDVQNWVNGTNQNFGWILIGDETNDRRARIFASKEATTATSRPTLSITYTEPDLSVETVSELADLEVLYPNPTSDLIHIKFQNSEDFTLRVFDVEGAKVYEAMFTNESDAVVELVNYASGVYFVNITNNGKSTTTRILKE